LWQHELVFAWKETLMRFELARVIASVVVSCVVVGGALAGDAVQSGLKPGETVNEFLVHDITGPNRDKSLCYRCKYKESPVVCVFARRPSDALGRLVQQIEVQIEEKKNLKTYVVLMPQNGENLAADLRKLAASAAIKYTPLTIGPGPDGPPAYQISKDADVTILMWRRGTVRANRAYKGELTNEDINAIVSDIPKILAE
jgi:hypothetical protein